jgi:hypothetical protein
MDDAVVPGRRCGALELDIPASPGKCVVDKLSKWSVRWNGRFMFMNAATAWTGLLCCA